MNPSSYKPADLRLLTHIGYLAMKMKWAEEGEAIFGALIEVVQSKAELYFTWLVARCELNDMPGASELLVTLQKIEAPADMLLMARCYVECCSDRPEWTATAKKVVQSGPGTFGYETACSMLDQQKLKSFA
jgi:hypothetical protein